MRPRAFAPWLAATAGSLLACARELPPVGQIVLHVETDARVLPADGDTITPGSPAPLFDRLRIELLPDGADEPCAECVRDFAATTDLFARGRASIGFVPRVGASGARARVTLHRAGGAAGPRAASSLVRVVSLPAVAADGIVDVWVGLRTADVGTPVGSLDAPVASDAHSTGLLPGSFDRDVAGRGCPEPGGTDEACVPGTSFWMGSPTHPLEGREHLVTSSPFYVDTREVTVGDLRAARLATATDPIRDARCHYADAPDGREDLPANCVSHGLAERYCALRGKTLLTEAAFERLATGAFDADYPWGRTPPSCTDAVYARDPKGSAAPYKACVSIGSGASRAGSGALDRVSFGDREVLDLAGNVAEWMRDVFQDDGESCWGAGVLRDPDCQTSSATQKGHSVRGGSFASSVLSLRASTRIVGSVDDSGAPYVGFRCMRRAD